MKKFIARMTLLNFLIYLFTPAGFLSLYAQNPVKHIAVLDLGGRGIAADEIKTLSERLRSHLVNTGAFVVLERQQMDEILKEQGFQQSGCVSDECLVEIGRVIGVEQMVGGSIGKIGSTYTLDLRLIDVESGRIEKTVSEDYRGDKDGLLETLKVAAERMAGKKTSGESGIAWYYWVGAGVLAAGAAILATGGSSNGGSKSNLPTIDGLEWPPKN